MKSLLQHIREDNSASLNSTIIIGAGNGQQLPDWRSLEAERLLLVEAHPRLAEELSRRLQPEHGEQLLALAITPTPCSEAQLLSFNNPSYSSLKAPTALQTHYPNLRPLETLTVPACNVTHLLSEQGLDNDEAHLLVIDAPGQALELLQAIPPTTLQALSWLIVGCTAEPLYENDVNAEIISHWLQDMGFDRVQEDPNAIYPQSRLLLKRNLATVQRQRLNSEVIELRIRLSEQDKSSQQRIAELQQQVQLHNNATIEQAKLATERQQQLEALEKQKAEVTAARDALAKEKTALTQARDEQAKLATERQQQVEALEKQKAELTAARDALAKEKTALTQARDEQAKLATEHKTQLDKVTTEHDQVQKTANERQKALEQAQQRIKTLENEASENLQRQQLLQEELIKAEAQIELIKDLLLREPGL